MGIFDRIKSGLKKTRDVFAGRVDELVENTRVIDDDFYDELTDILIMADVGMKSAVEVIDRLREDVAREKITDPEQAKARLKAILAAMMGGDSMSLKSPMIVLVIGVNGVGKTTSIGSWPLA